MGMKQSDIKLLWGRSGGRCALCKLELSMDPKHQDASHPIGEQAHIIAKEPNGPRGKSVLTTEERDHYSNLILLCPTDHVRIDKAPVDFPVEKLHLLKAEHEDWVRSRLAEGDVPRQANDLIYAHLIDAAIENCHLATW